MNSNDPQVEAEKHRLQMEYIMLEADFKKKEREKMAFEIELKSLKLKSAQIEAEIFQADHKLKKTEVDIVMLHNNMVSMKHKMMLL